MHITSTQAAALGLIAPVKPAPGSHDAVVIQYPCWMLDAVIADAGTRNLRDYRDHETRWLAERCKAARAERRRRALKGGRK